MTHSKFAVVEIHMGFSNEKPSLPWRILELYSCLDGYRTRICMDAYATQGEALYKLEEYWKAQGVE